MNIFASAVSVVCAAGLMLGGNRLVFTPKENTSPVMNPHKGFVQQLDSFDASSDHAKLTAVLYDEFSVSELKSGNNFDFDMIDSSLGKCVSSGRSFAAGITADNADDADAMKKLAAALADEYDGSENIEFICIELPDTEEKVQKEILDSFDNAFDNTALAFSPEHALYSYAASVGMIPYDNEAELSEYTDEKYFPLGSSADIKIAEEIQNKAGYNFVVKYASFYYDKNDAVLSVKIKNTGSAPQSFPITLEAAISDKNGTSFTRTGGTAVIRADAHGSGSEQTYEIRFERSLIPNKNDVYIAVGAFEDSSAVSPDIRLANKLTGNTDYIVLGKVK